PRGFGAGRGRRDHGTAAPALPGGRRPVPPRVHPHRPGQGASLELSPAATRGGSRVMAAGEPPSPPRASPPQASPPQASPPQASPPQASPPRTNPRSAPGELELIRLIRRIAEGGPAERVETGIGDDTAVLRPQPGARLLATTDVVVEDVHFRRAWASPFDIGWKAMAVNLSDIAGKGGRPLWALVGLALPAPADPTEVEALYEGMRQAASPHGVAIVG